MNSEPNTPNPAAPTPQQKAAQIWQLATDQQAAAAEALQALKARTTNRQEPTA